MLKPREEVKKVHCVLCTSDRGLCGGFNSALISRAQSFLKEKLDQGIEVSFTNFGKKGFEWCKKTESPIINKYLGIVGGRFGFNIASTAGRNLIDGFLDGTYDEVYLIGSEFLGMARQLPVLKKMIPVPPIEHEETETPDETKPFLASKEHLCSVIQRIIGDFYQ